MEIRTNHGYQWQLHRSCCIFSISVFSGDSFEQLLFLLVLRLIFYLFFSRGLIPIFLIYSVSSLLVSCNGCATPFKCTNFQCLLWNTWMRLYIQCFLTIWYCNSEHVLWCTCMETFSMEFRFSHLLVGVSQDSVGVQRWATYLNSLFSLWGVRAQLRCLNICICWDSAI